MASAARLAALTGTRSWWREPLAGSWPPEAAVELVRDDTRPFVLVGEWAGGGAIAGSDPVVVADDRANAEDRDPFEILETGPTVVGRPPAGGVGGGWFGRLGFGLARRVEPTVGGGPPRPVALPDWSLAFYDHVVRCDADGRWWFEALVSPERQGVLAERLAVLRARAARLGAAASRPAATAPWASVPSPAGHAAAVRAARTRIHAGDLFQANLCLRLESTLLTGDVADLFRGGVQALRPARAAFLGGPDADVASLSPELFLSRTGRRVVSQPIKGTRPRPAEQPARATAQRAALSASEKDGAENVMIVDLVRNDLGRVCRVGSVEVVVDREVQAHAGVWHLVSEVAGELRPGVGDAELLRATFPPGSVTGAPKVAALATIAELESTGRETYTGAIGFASPVAGLELNVAIRTIEHRDGRLWMGVGGGVVADSDPAEEAEEAATKAAPVLGAIGACLAPAVSQAPATRSVLRLSPRPLPRPDPQRGVFATLLVCDGRAVEGARHLARLGASVRELFGVELPADATAQLERACRAAGPEPCRLRLTHRGPATGLTVERHPLPSAAGPTALRSFVVPGGLGCHKFDDRRLLDALAAEADGALPLLVDLDGGVLEASRANLVIAQGGRLLTPPEDGRIWAGTTRERLIEAGVVEAAAVTLDALRRSDAAWLTGALRGPEPVGEVDGVTLPDAATHPAAPRLAAALDRRAAPA